MTRCAFTLIEVMAVVVLLGLLAGTVAWTMASQADRATLDDAIGRIAHADRMARLAADRTGEACVLRVDLAEGRLWRESVGIDGEPTRSHPVGVPGGFAVDRVIVAGPTADAGDLFAPGQVIDIGTVGIAIAPPGRGPTYAVRLRSSDPTARWLVFAGLSGQMTVIDDEQQAQQLMATLSGDGPDAD